MKVSDLNEELDGRPDVPVLVHDVEAGKHYEVTDASFMPVFWPGGVVMLELGREVEESE